jgi:hypothetical protein
MLNAGRSVGDEPFLVSALVRVALRSIMLHRLERILAQGEVSEEELLKLQQALEREENEPILHRSARGERASLDRMMAALQSGRITYAQMRRMMAQGSSAKLYGLEDWAFWATAGPPEVNRARFLELNNRFVEISQQPAEEILPALNKLTEHVNTNEPRFVRGLFLPVEKVGGAYVRITAQTRAARVMLAAERFRLRHGRWPETLDELVPEFLDKVPIDPFDGKPLRWLRKSDGWTIYSVSKDGLDNEGNLSDRYLLPGVDLGYRLYDVDQRRKRYEE